MPTVNSQNWTTLYSATAQEITPQEPYGNANVEHFLNVGTDGGNTVQNILANGTIYANGNIESNGYFVGDGGYLSNITATTVNANFANFAGNVTNSAQPNITSVGTLVNLTVTGNITSTTGIFNGNGSGLTNVSANTSNLANVSNANATSAGTFYPVFVSGTGNVQLNIDDVGNTLEFYPSTATLRANAVRVDYVTNDGTPSVGETIELDGGNNSIKLSVTGLANAVTISNANVTVNSNLNVTGNIFPSKSIIFANNSSSPDILVSNNASNTTTRQLSLQAGNLDYTGVASNQTAGTLRINSGNSDGSGSATTWIARGGSQILAAGFATSNIGNALGGAYNILAGDATSLLTGNSTTGAFLMYGGAATANVGNARNGNMEFLGGGAYTETGNSQGGNIVITAGSATSNTSGNAVAGSIYIDTQTATGVTSNTQGNINIGTGGAAQAINIGHGSATIYANTGIEVAPNVGIHTVFDGGAGNYPYDIMWRSNTYIGGGPEATAQWQPVTSRGTLASPANIGGGDTILKFETAVNTGTTTGFGPYTGYSYGPAIRAINTFNPGVDPNPVGYAYSYGNIQFATAGNLNSNDYVLRTDLGPNGVSVYGFVPTNGFAAADTRFDINLSNGSSYNPTVTAGSFDGNGNLTVNNSVNANMANITTVATVGNNAANTVTFTTNSVGSNLVTLNGNYYHYNSRIDYSDNPIPLSTQDVVVTNFDVANSQGQAYEIQYFARDNSNTANLAYMGYQQFYPFSYASTGDKAIAGYYQLTMFHTGSDLANADINTGSSYNIGNPGLGFLVGAPIQYPAGTPIIGVTSYGRDANPVESVAMRFTRRRGNGVARLSLEPNDYLGNIEWRGSQAGGAAPAGSRWPKIAPQVDSSYVANTAAVPAGINFIVCDNTTNYTHTFYANGNVNFSNNVNASSFSTANTNIYANGAVNTNGELTADNVKIDTNGFMKLSSYTAAGLNAITGQIGWMAAVSDSASGGNPNGMIAFWDTTNARWSYVHDNSAV